jgi:hypothetical protein
MVIFNVQIAVPECTVSVHRRHMIFIVVLEDALLNFSGTLGGCDLVVRIVLRNFESIRSEIQSAYFEGR